MVYFAFIIYNKERWYSLKLSYKIKSTCILYYYITIEIHKAIEKLPIIPKKWFVLSNMYYCGVYNPLDKQLIYDKNGNILKYIQKPSGKKLTAKQIKLNIYYYNI